MAAELKPMLFHVAVGYCVVSTEPVEVNKLLKYLETSQEGMNGAILGKELLKLLETNGFKFKVDWGADGVKSIVENVSVSGMQPKTISFATTGCGTKWNDDASDDANDDDSEKQSSAKATTNAQAAELGEQDTELTITRLSKVIKTLLVGKTEVRVSEVGAAFKKLFHYSLKGRMKELVASTLYKYNENEGIGTDTIS
jgi:hypothetical protein